MNGPLDGIQWAVRRLRWPIRFPSTPYFAADGAVVGGSAIDGVVEPAEVVEG